MNKFNLTEGDFCEETAICVNGNLYDIGVKTVRWDNPKGFNAYSTKPFTTTSEDRKTGKTTQKTVQGKRYQARKSGLLSINQFMLHHTGGFSVGPCFETLHNQRKLSVHFILDEDGTIYQTLDVKECAWHGGSHNNQSVGVECVLYPDADNNSGMYSPDRQKKYNLLPHDIIDQYIQGDTRKVFAIPSGQRESLAKLVAGTWVALANELNHNSTFMEPPVFMEDDKGETLMDFSPSAKAHTGMILHANASAEKWDLAGLGDYDEFESEVSKFFFDFQKSLG